MHKCCTCCHSCELCVGLCANEMLRVYHIHNIAVLGRNPPSRVYSSEALTHQEHVKRAFCDDSEWSRSWSVAVAVAVAVAAVAVAVAARSRSLSVAAGGASKGQGKRVREELVDGSPPPGMRLQTRAQGRSDVSTCEYREGGDMWQGKCDHWAHLARKMLWHLCACKLQAESPACPPRTKRLGGVAE
jgi:hypothetical protein